MGRWTVDTNHFDVLEGTLAKKWTVETNHSFDEADEPSIPIPSIPSNEHSRVDGPSILSIDVSKVMLTGVMHCRYESLLKSLKER